MEKPTVVHFDWLNRHDSVLLDKISFFPFFLASFFSHFFLFDLIFIVFYAFICHMPSCRNREQFRTLNAARGSGGAPETLTWSSMNLVWSAAVILGGKMQFYMNTAKYFWKTGPYCVADVMHAVARLTWFEGRGHKKVPKGPPFAYVFWKNFKNKLSKGGVLAFSHLPLDFTGGGGHGPLAPSLNAPLDACMKTYHCPRREPVSRFVSVQRRSKSTKMPSSPWKEWLEWQNTSIIHKKLPQRSVEKKTHHEGSRDGRLMPRCSMSLNRHVKGNGTLAAEGKKTWELWRRLSFAFTLNCGKKRGKYECYLSQSPRRSSWSSHPQRSSAKRSPNCLSACPEECLGLKNGQISHTCAMKS